MRFVFYEINNVFEIKNGFVNSLVIENRDLFFRMLKDVSLAVEGVEGSAVLSKEHKPISFPKNVEILSDFSDQCKNVIGNTFPVPAFSIHGLQCCRSHRQDTGKEYPSGLRQGKDA
jgi:hypothetical protein